MQTDVTPQIQPKKPKLLDQVREIIRLKHYSIRTEQAYIHWIRSLILFQRKRHPAEIQEAEVTQFPHPSGVGDPDIPRSRWLLAPSKGDVRSQPP